MLHFQSFFQFKNYFIIFSIAIETGRIVYKKII